MQARCHSWRWRWRSPQIALRCYACGCHMLWRNQGWKQLSVPHPNFCFLFDLISILPQPSPSSRPASRFLTAPGLCSAHFFSPPVPVSFPLSRTTAASTNHNPPNASPWSPAQSYWTYSFWVSTVLTYRFFRAETFLEIPGLAPCLVENKGLGKGWKRS